MLTGNRRWIYVAMVLCGAVGAWGFSCVEVEGVDPRLLKGEQPTECQGVEDDAPCAILAGPCQTGKCNSIGLCEFTPIELPNPCVKAVCTEGQLEEQRLPDGAFCSTDGVGTGQKSFCVAGNCIIGQCYWNADCTGEQAYCSEYQCVSCKDGMNNGDEADVDCGGHCGRCLGETCTGSSECAKGNCVDGVCCNENCGEKCRACNVSGKEGTCSDVPFLGMDDNNGSENDCIDTKQCDGQAVCKSALNLPCSLPDDCASGLCFSLETMGFACKLDVGDPCIKDNAADCFTGFCGKMDTCAKAPSGHSCFSHLQCASGTCNMGNKTCN